jgi:hypothetical protein
VVVVVDVAYGLVVIYIESVELCFRGGGGGVINADTRSEKGVSLSGGPDAEGLIYARPDVT